MRFMISYANDRQILFYCNIHILSHYLFITEVNITLNSLLRNSDKLRDLLQDGFEFTPDIFSALLNAEMSLSVTDLTMNSTINLQHFLCAAKYVILLAFVVNKHSWTAPNVKDFL